ncbi:MAG: potassium/proton antiporter [Lentisphaeria bacterium]|nr:potassium/proton antiporter [Lentisphaeria bacterium]
MDLFGGIAIVAFLLLLSLMSSKISAHINMPCLLLFLVVGMLAGSEGIGRLKFDDAAMANAIGSIAMAFILFSGGFDTEIDSVKKVFLPGMILSSLGVLLTALFCGCFIWWICKLIMTEKQLSFSWCLLAGAIISSTDAAAVFSILRSQSVSLKGKLQSLLEFESGSNDPMAAFLTIFMINIVLLESKAGEVNLLNSYLMLIPTFLYKMAIGLLTGYIIGKAAVWIYDNIDFEYNGLYYVLGIVVVLATFSSAELLKGNGFMAVYTAGVIMGNKIFVFHKGVGRFYDGVAWLMQVILFILLGLLVYPSKLLYSGDVGLLAALFLMFIARPAATFLCLIRSEFTFKERLFVSWVGLRGGAPIVLATFPLMNGVYESSYMFHIVFFIVLTSVIFQGMTIMPVAKILQLDAPLKKKPRSPLSIEETGNKEMISRELIVTREFGEKTLAEIKLPKGTLILMITRDEKIIIPKGGTTLQQDDMLTVLGSPEGIKECRSIFSQ